MSNTFKYLRADNQEEEGVQEEVWQWEAIFQDGSNLSQFDQKTGLFHQFTEIDQSKLAVFKMISPTHPQVYSLVFDAKTMKLIHFYRNVVLEAATESERRVKLYCFGYEDKSKKQIFAITPESELIITTDPDLIIFE
jgi:hypothetical protein